MSFPLVGLESILKDKAFNAAISNYLASMDKMDDKTTTAAGRIGKTFQNIGALAVSGGLALAVAGVTALGAASFKTAQEFDSAFDNVVQQTGITGAALEGLKTDAKAVFSDLPVDIDKAAGVMGVLKQRIDLTGESAQGLGKQLLRCCTDDAAARPNYTPASWAIGRSKTKTRGSRSTSCSGLANHRRRHRRPDEQGGAVR
jgi:hypothetical protein